MGTHETNPTEDEVHRLPELRAEVSVTGPDGEHAPAGTAYVLRAGSYVAWNGGRRHVASKWPAGIAGGAAGLANGLFGGGGGMVFLPILCAGWGTLNPRQLLRHLRRP